MGDHIAAADRDAIYKIDGHGIPRSDGGTTLVSTHSGAELTRIMDVKLPESGQGSQGLLDAIAITMQYSVNTWDPGFMDKLYASTDAPGLAAELVLATLNTNVHVYSTSPALTVIEKATTKALAGLFGLRDEHSGGVSIQGGAASNFTSILVARNFRFPEVKAKGTSALSRPLAIFTSYEAHYSITSAAVSLGFGTEAVYSVAVDKHGQMDVTDLERLVKQALKDGRQPFYVNATAGTTVRGAYDPLVEIGQICHKYDLWFHIDAAWGGPAIFSNTHKRKLHGSQNADSIAFNPHKMMGVPLTCSFLLAQDLRKFYAANALSAGYLFHNDLKNPASTFETQQNLPAAADVYDLASFTPQCGRRGDSLKLYLSWIYHGTLGYAKHVDLAFAACRYMTSQLSRSEDFLLINEDPPPCCQCCFYYRPQILAENLFHNSDEAKVFQSKITRHVVAGLLQKGWMVDYAPGELGEFLRVVTNRNSTTAIVDGLLIAIVEAGKQAIQDFS